MSYLSRRISARLPFALSASLAAIAIATPAWAQNDTTTATTTNAGPASADNNDAAADSNEIVVTAQFRAQNIQDTPLAITAVNAETMEAKSQTNLAQVADSTPNVQLKPQGASFGPSIAISIRGIGGADFNPAYESGVGIYIDDVYYPQLTGAVFDLLDLDRVEILRGPQGTLSGRNSEGGSIKMFTKKPNDDEGGYVEGTFGADQRIGIRGGVDFKLTDDLFARISGVYKHENGYVDRYDFGCLYPEGGPATFTANDGTTKQVNPEHGIPALRGQGSCLIDKLGEIGYGAIRGALRYNPSDAVDINLTGEYIHDDHTAAGEVLVATALVDNPNSNLGTNPAQYSGGAPGEHSPGIPFDNRFICGKFCSFSSYSSPAITYHGVLTPPAGQPLLATQNSDQSVYDAYNLAANAHFALSDMFSIDNILAYQNWKTNFGVDDDISPIPLSGGYNNLTHWNWSEELRLNAKLANTINFVIGGYYFKQETDYYSYQDLRYVNAAPGVGLEPLQFIQPDRTPAQAKAAFADVSWDITSGLTFDGGVRYTDESKDYHYFRYNPDGTVNQYVDPVGAANGAGTPGALTGLVAHYQGSRWDWRGALNYRFSPDVMVYGSFSTGFKGGGTNPRPFFASQALPFDPEVLYNWEVGLKTDLFDRRLRFDIDGFYGILRNAQVVVTSCPVANPLEQTPCAATVNGGNAHEKGVEAEFTARPVDGLSIDGSLSYLDFHYTSIIASSGILLTDPFAGAPKWKWTLGAQYEVDVPGFGSITPRVDATYQDEVYTGAKFNDQPEYIGAYTLVNARLTWQNEKKDLSISAEVTNLTNKYYYLTLFDLRADGAGLDKAQPGRPREWAVTVKKSF